MSRRTEKLGSLLRQEITQVIQRELADPRISHFPAITRVEVADDLSNADVFFTVMGTPGEQTATLHALQHSAGRIRKSISKGIRIRQMPFLSFKLDDRLRKEIETLEILHKLNAERREQGQDTDDPQQDQRDETT